jgi:hypothetical protein
MSSTTLLSYTVQRSYASLARALQAYSSFPYL